MMMMVTKMMSMVMILPGGDLMLAPTLLAPVPVLVEYKALPEGFERCVRYANNGKHVIILKQC